jgi:hypothetical protein
MKFRSRYAVFSCLGLGDGLIALVLSNNLHLNGGAVTTFHPFLEGLQEWFPHLPLRQFPPLEDIERVLKEFDYFFILYEKTPWMQAVLTHCQKHYPGQTTVLNPIATTRRDYAYWEEGRFNGRISFVENLYAFCKDILRFSVVTKANGLEVPEHVKTKRFSHRVILHPTSSREGKNWPKEKYIALAERLHSQGLEPSFLLTQEERKKWKLERFLSPLFLNQPEMAAFVCESGYMIGNDSGIGHLASCLNVPTLTICRSAHSARFWRPAWAPGKVLTPSGWIPNLKGLRWRDKHWKKWISVEQALKSFHHIKNSMT